MQAGVDVGERFAVGAEVDARGDAVEFDRGPLYGKHDGFGAGGGGGDADGNGGGAEIGGRGDPGEFVVGEAGAGGGFLEIELGRLVAGDDSERHRPTDEDGARAVDFDL